MRRRALLAAVGGALPISLAGCLGDDDEPSNGERQPDGSEEENGDDEDEPTDEQTDDVNGEGDDEVDEDEEDEEESDEEEPELTVDEEITAHEDGFSPSVISVDRGAVVAWTSDNDPQNVSFYHEDTGTQTRVPIATEALDETVDDEPVTFEFSQEGVYDYYNGELEDEGAVGSIVVGEVPDPTQPGLSAPVADIPEAARTELEILNEEVAELLGIERPPQPAQNADIELTAEGVEPRLKSIESGGTVTWSALDGENTVAFYHEDVPVERPSDDGEGETEQEPRQHRVPEEAEPFKTELSEGEQVTVELAYEGIYDYYCQQREEEGLVGSLMIGDRSERDQPGLDEPDETIPETAAAELTDLTERTVIRATVNEVNQVITALNHQPEQSVSVLNSYIESDETVSYIATVEATTFDEVAEEAERLRSVRDEMANRILHVVPQEANRQLPIPPIFSADDIETPDDAREEADELEDQEASEVYGEAPDRLREAADFTEALTEQLTELAEELESVLQ